MSVGEVNAAAAHDGPSQRCRDSFVMPPPVSIEQPTASAANASLEEASRDEAKKKLHQRDGGGKVEFPVSSRPWHCRKGPIQHFQEELPEKKNKITCRLSQSTVIANAAGKQ